MKVVLCVIMLGAVADTALLLQFLDTDSGKALSYNNGTVTTFEDQIYGDDSQLWKFTKDRELLIYRKYLGFDGSNNIILEDSAAKAWYWEEGKLKTSPTMCISKDASQVVKCDQGANITLQIFEEEIYNLIKDIGTLINKTTAQMNANITELEKTAASLNTAVAGAATKVDTWNVSMSEYSSNYTNQTTAISENMILAKGHLDKDIETLNDKMSTLEGGVKNATSKINATNVNFAALGEQLKSYQNRTNNTVQRTVQQLQDELEKKATNGHLIPDNIYEFTVLFLFALGVVNVCDIVRRLITHAINESVHVQYGEE